MIEEKEMEEEIPEWKKRELENWSGIVYIVIYGRIGKKAREFFENDIFELGNCEKIEVMDIGYLYYFFMYAKEGKLFEQENNKKKGIIYTYYVKRVNVEFFKKIDEIFKKFKLKGGIVYGHFF